MPATTLSKRVKMIWGLSLHGWEDLMRASLLVVGVFGLIAGLSTWFVVKLQRAELAQSKLEFDKYKLDADTKVESAKAAGDTAKAEVEKAQAAISVAKAEAEKARLEQERLKLLVTWRILPEGNKSELTNALKGGSGNVLINHAMNDPEAQYFALQLEHCFENTSWKVGFGGLSFNEGMAFGLFIWGPDSGPSQAIKDAFAKAKITFSSQPAGSTAISMGAVDPRIKWDVTIFVGSKAIPH